VEREEEERVVSPSHLAGFLFSSLHKTRKSTKYGEIKIYIE
jgi:hypothetical protein